MNTFFEKRRDHRVTYKSGCRGMWIDYNFCNLKEIRDCKAVVGENVSRQHKMVVCRMTLVMKKKERALKKRQKAELEVVEIKMLMFSLVVILGSVGRLLCSSYAAGTCACYKNNALMDNFCFLPQTARWLQLHIRFCHRVTGGLCFTALASSCCASWCVWLEPISMPRPPSSSS